MTPKKNKKNAWQTQPNSEILQKLKPIFEFKQKVKDGGLTREQKLEIKAVNKYYRNFSTINNSLVKNGFVIEELNECKPNDEMISKNPKYINQYECPYFLFVKVRKGDNNE